MVTWTPPTPRELPALRADMAERLATAGIDASIGTVGDSYDCEDVVAVIGAA